MNRPWTYDSNTPSAAAEYGLLLRKQLKDTFERALKSLARDGVLVCEELQRILYPHSVDTLKCLAAINVEAQKPNSCLDPNLLSSLLPEADSKGLFFSQPDGRATDMQNQAIENYKLYLRQCVYGSFSSCDVLPSKEIDWISQVGKFFTSYKYRKKYAELDMKLREPLLGGIWFWKEYQYSIIDPVAATTYRCENCAEIASQLTKKMVEFMNVKMSTHNIYLRQEDLSDLVESSFLGQIRCGSTMPLKCFKSALDIHQQIKTLYGAGF